MSHHQPRDLRSALECSPGIVPSATGRVLGVTVAAGRRGVEQVGDSRRQKVADTFAFANQEPTESRWVHAIVADRRPRAVIIIGAAMLIKLVTTPARKPLDLPTASMIDD